MIDELQSIEITVIVTLFLMRAFPKLQVLSCRHYDFEDSNCLVDELYAFKCLMFSNQTY